MSGVLEWSHGMEFWSGFGVEWSQILNFCHPSRTGFYD